jgi:hypothetical protein
MLPDIRDYDALYRQFRWQVPARYNIGTDVCDRAASRSSISIPTAASTRSPSAR